MLATYAGEVHDGQPVILENIALPENARLIITVIDKDLDATKESRNKALAQKQKEALNQLYQGLKEIDDEPFDEEFDVMMRSGFQGRDLDI